MKAAVVDDERKETELLSSYLERYGKELGIEVMVRAFYSADEFLDNYTHDFDIVFMDIEMPGIINGLQAAHELRKIDANVVLMFVTNMAQYAIKGYEVEAVDFVLKPLAYTEFVMKMNRAFRYIRRNEEKRIEVQTTEGTVYLLLSDIYYIEVIRHYLVYHTSVGEFRARGTMKSVEESLGVYHFCRSNNCYLINLKYVQAVRDNLVVVAGENLQMSRGRKNEFISQLSKYF